MGRAFWLDPGGQSRNQGASMRAVHSSVCVGFSRPFGDELLGFVVLAKLTAGVFPGSRGLRLSPVYALRHA